MSGCDCATAGLAASKAAAVAKNTGFESDVALRMACSASIFDATCPWICDLRAGPLDFNAGYPSKAHYDLQPASVGHRLLQCGDCSTGASAR